MGHEANCRQNNLAVTKIFTSWPIVGGISWPQTKPANNSSRNPLSF